MQRFGKPARRQCNGEFRSASNLQQGISSEQMNEMEAEKVILVVPKEYIKTYPREKQESIWPVKKFIAYVKEVEGI